MLRVISLTHQRKLGFSFVDIGTTIFALVKVDYRTDVGSRDIEDLNNKLFAAYSKYIMGTTYKTRFAPYSFNYLKYGKIEGTPFFYNTGKSLDNTYISITKLSRRELKINFVSNKVPFYMQGGGNSGIPYRQFGKNIRKNNLGEKYGEYFSTNATYDNELNIINFLVKALGELLILLAREKVVKRRVKYNVRGISPEEVIREETKTYLALAEEVNLLSYYLPSVTSKRAKAEFSKFLVLTPESQKRKMLNLLKRKGVKLGI